MVSGGITASSLVQSAGEFTFLQAKIDAQETERKRLQEELKKTRIDALRRGDAGKHIIEATDGTAGSEWPKGPHYGTPQGDLALTAGEKEVPQHLLYHALSICTMQSLRLVFGRLCFGSPPLA